MEQAQQEAKRCLDCVNPGCITGCPVEINIPKFIKNIERGEVLEAARTLKETSALPAVCGRVCPQEKQCESKCIYVQKMNKEAVAIGHLERFAADFERESGQISVPDLDESNGIKIAVIGSGPSGLSFAGDMYVIDEFNNLGWFASDRYQPEGKVCIYIFIPNESKQIYDYDSTDNGKLISLAKISSIKESWKGREADVKAAKERLAEVRNSKPQAKENNEFEFVINDNITYTRQADFTSPKAIELVKKWQQALSDYKEQAQKLEKQRDTYYKSTKDKQNSLAPGILDLEKRVEQMDNEIKLLEISIRNEENNFLKK